MLAGMVFFETFCKVFSWQPETFVYVATELFRREMTSENHAIITEL